MTSDPADSIFALSEEEYAERERRIKAFAKALRDLKFHRRGVVRESEERAKRACERVEMELQDNNIVPDEVVIWIDNLEVKKIEKLKSSIYCS